MSRRRSNGSPAVLLVAAGWEVHGMRYAVAEESWSRSTASRVAVTAVMDCPWWWLGGKTLVVMGDWDMIV